MTSTSSEGWMLVASAAQIFSCRPLATGIESILKLDALPIKK
jgi:hypothetical protein